MKPTLGLIAGLLLSLPAWATPLAFVEPFDGPLESATWRVGTLDQIAPSGGRPGSYLRNTELDAAVPAPIYFGPAGSPFLGDYRAARVVSLGLNVNVFSALFGVDPKRPVSLVLGSDMGTPDDFSDDCELWLVGHKALPQPGDGWRSFDFTVPVASPRLPGGWQVIGACGGLGSDAAWNYVVTHVTSVSFPFSQPDVFWFFQIWDLGIDSVRITFAP